MAVGFQMMVGVGRLWRRFIHRLTSFTALTNAEDINVMTRRVLFRIFLLIIIIIICFYKYFLIIPQFHFRIL